MQPVHQILSAVSTNNGAAQPARPSTRATDDDGFVFALILASIAAVVLVLVLPLVLIFVVCYMKRARGGVQVDPKELTSIVTAAGTTPALLTDASTQCEASAEAAAIAAPQTSGLGVDMAAGDIVAPPPLAAGARSPPIAAASARSLAPGGAPPVRTDISGGGSPSPRAAVALTL